MPQEPPTQPYEEDPNTNPSALHALTSSGASSGDWDAFFRHYGAAIYEIALRSRLNPEAAQEVTQCVLVDLCKLMSNPERKSARYDRAKGAFRSWIRRVVGRACLDYRRKENKHQRDRDRRQELTEIVQDEFSEQIAQDSRIILFDLAERRALARLRAEDRLEVWSLIREGRFEPDQIAEQVGRDRAYVDVVKYQVLGMIREEVGNLATEEE